ncbi:MAG: YceI family protein [Acidimicrobiales bacterium]
MIPSGTYDIGPAQGTFRLHTSREGMAKKIGHDLIIEATKWSAKVTVADDVTKSSAQVTVDTRSFKVISGAGGAKPLSDKDRKDIEENIDKKVLKTDKFPEITFTSKSVTSGGADKATVSGDLTIMGTARPASMDITLTGNKATGTMTVTQSDWGIKPFSALMGALKLADTLTIQVEATVPG